MRTQDEEKKQALFEATIKLVNEVGFASSSVSKIAKAANVSPSTLYIYHENKEDLLVSTYISIKMEFAEAIMGQFDESLPLRDTIRKFCLGMYSYMAKNPEKSMFVEQFSNTPYAELVNNAELDEVYQPLKDTFQRGVEQKILKDVSIELFAAFSFHPFARLANPRHCCKNFVMTEEDIEMAFSMAWDAIRY